MFDAQMVQHMRLAGVSKENGNTPGALGRDQLRVIVDRNIGDTLFLQQFRQHFANPPETSDNDGLTVAGKVCHFRILQIVEPWRKADSLPEIG